MKKRSRPQMKKLLPEELYVNTKLDKRGKGDMKKVMTVRLTESEALRLNDMIYKLGIKRANLIRYGIKLVLENIEAKLNEEEEK